MAKTLTTLVLLIGLAAGLTAQLQAPRPPRPPAPPRPPQASFRIDDSRQRWTFTTGATRVSVESRGQVELTDDEQDVKSVSANGYFEISSRRWLSLFGQRYVVRGLADGSVSRVYSVGGAARPISAEARAWIADTIQRLVRSGFNAEARAQRILSTRGPTGLLDEVSRFSNDFTKAQYLTLLLKVPTLDRPTAERALKATGELGSDFEKARVLTAFVEAVRLDEPLPAAFIDATKNIGSDFEQARVLFGVMAAQQPTPAVTKIVLAVAPAIGSDFEKARVLGELAQRKDIGNAGIAALLQATGSIGSDFEKSRVLLQIIASQPLEAANRQALLDTARGIGSDHERGRVLSAMLQGGALR